MGQVLHGSATTTEAVRRSIQNSQESLRALATRHGINQKTLAKREERAPVADLPTGPIHPKSTVLPAGEEAIIAAFRRHTLLPLDDFLFCAPAHPPAPGRLLVPSLSAAARNWTAPRCGGRQASQEGAQELPPSASPKSTLPQCREPTESSWHKGNVNRYCQNTVLWICS